MRLSLKSKTQSAWLVAAFSLVLVFSAGVTARASDVASDIDDEGEVRGDGRSPASVLSTRPPRKNGVTVLQIDPKLPIGRLQRLGYRVRTHAEINREDPWRDPSVKLRDDVFLRAGLEESLQGWDHLAKDMLFLRAQDQRLEQLAANYPKISRSRLVSLQRTIRRAKGAKR